MRTHLSLIIAICLSFAVFSQTPVPEGPVNGTWTLAGSPYLVEGETFVLEGTILTIEPGVMVEWQGSYPLWVQGQILAQGNESDSITFTATNPTNGWQGIRFDFSDIPEEDVDTSRFEYCTFKYGRVYKAIPNNWGGAIAVIEFSKVIIDHCYFTKNTAIVFNGDNPAGGAIALGNSSPKITNCLFTDNLSFSGGAIICYGGSNPLIESNIFTDNTADGEGEYGQGYGGAIVCYVDSDPMIRNNTFSDNYAEAGGGAVACVSRCDALIIQNLLYNNTAGWGGAIELQDTCNAQIINNTIVNNYGSIGGGIDMWDSCTANITNTILWGNHAEDGSAGQIYLSTGLPNVVNLYYSCLLGGWDGIGGFVINGEYEDCIEDFPIFAGSGEHPFQLNDPSPCIDKGDPDSEDYSLPEKDLAGQVRIFNDIIDIGAYEWNPSVGIDESAINSLKSAFNCFPNPTSEITNINFELSQSGMVEIHIYGQTGELIEVIEKIMQAGEQTLTWDSGTLSPGVYYIQMKLENETMVQKIIKM